ncbi:SDR family NAD(P)-dependent oxidoreductase [Marispirochaeta sp.]|uniref:SDR family NAD(P)-dependent oxidoreductase n=1 Tax=Marispirochaeta sp. TaxID=2038653 RepID=UPI0029C650DA|nr:SDR family NAD(P)-dependent oxidoreductase [Marispirochaeta sp.]
MHSYYKDKYVIVTGGAGFIGSHLCEALVKNRANVIAVDNLIAGKKKNIIHLNNENNFKFVEADVCNREEMLPLLKDCEIIFHNAASKKNVCLTDSHKDLEINAGGTLNLLELANEFGIDRFIHASTGSVYGEPIIMPTTEKHPLRPVSYYGVSKLAGERYVDVFNRLYGLKTTILRYFHVYGTRQESNEFGGVVSIFLRNIKEGKPLRIFGSGRQVRSFTWVKDLVEANLRVGESHQAIGEVYNIASGIQVSIEELAQGLIKLTGKQSEILYEEPLIGDIDYFEVSSNKISESLDVQFTKDFWGTISQSIDQFYGYL